MAKSIGALQPTKDIGALQSTTSVVLTEVLSDNFELSDAIIAAIPELSAVLSDALHIWDDATVTGYPWIGLVLSELLSFSDVIVASFPELYVEVDDTLELSEDFTYEVRGNPSVSDNIFAFYDEVVTYLAVYHHPLPVDIEDVFELTDTLEYVYDAEDELGELSDSVRLEDEVNLQIVLELTFEDTLELLDEVETMAGEFVDYAYDTMMYDFLDAVEIDFRDHRSVADSFLLLDTISTSITNFLISQNITDSLNAWNDAVVRRVVCSDVEADTLKMYDFVAYFLTTIRSVGDVFSLSDSVIVGLSVTNKELNDSADLWADLVAASMTVPLEVTKSDTLTQSDAVSNSGIQEDTSYYRRYLNDVKV